MTMWFILFLLVILISFIVWMFGSDRSTTYVSGIGFTYYFGRVRRILERGEHWIFPWEKYLEIPYSAFSSKMASGLADPNDLAVHSTCRQIALEIEKKLRECNLKLKDGMILSYFSMERQGSLLSFRIQARKYDRLPFWKEGNSKKYFEDFWEAAEGVNSGETGIFETILLSILLHRWMEQTVLRNEEGLHCIFP